MPSKSRTMLKQLIGAHERKKMMLTPIKMLKIVMIMTMRIMAMMMMMTMMMTMIMMMMIYLLVLLLLAIFLASRCDERLDNEELPKL